MAVKEGLRINTPCATLANTACVVRCQQRIGWHFQLRTWRWMLTA